MSQDQLDLNAIRHRVEQRINKRKEFFIHVSIYVIVNVFLWLLWAFLNPFLSSLLPDVPFIQAPWPLIVTLGWGIGVSIHAIVYYFETIGLDRAREREFDLEIERERMRLGLGSAKAKRQARLSDDGEIVYEEEPERKTSRGNSSR
jgi:hypothetical protein